MLLSYKEKSSTHIKIFSNENEQALSQLDTIEFLLHHLLSSPYQPILVMLRDLLQRLRTCPLVDSSGPQMKIIPF